MQLWICTAQPNDSVSNIDNNKNVFLSASVLNITKYITLIIGIVCVNSAAIAIVYPYFGLTT